MQSHRAGDADAAVLRLLPLEQVLCVRCYSLWQHATSQLTWCKGHSVSPTGVLQSAMAGCSRQLQRAVNTPERQVAKRPATQTALNAHFGMHICWQKTVCLPGGLVSKMFSGLMSAWTTPLLCIKTKQPCIAHTAAIVSRQLPNIIQACPCHHTVAQAMPRMCHMNNLCLCSRLAR